MDLINVHTYEDFATYLQERVKIEDDIESTISWFIAMTEADLILNSFNKKDIAHLLLYGYPSIQKNLKTAVESYLETIFEECGIVAYDDEDEEGDTEELKEMALDTITEHLNRHFGRGYNW